MSVPEDGDCAVYLLATPSLNRTYIGQTNCFGRRIRQHRGEIAGGARATRNQRMRPVLLVRGPLTLRERLRLEKKWKRVSSGPRSDNAAHRRIFGLARVLAMPRWFKSQNDGDVDAIRRKIVVEWHIDPRVHRVDGGLLFGIDWPEGTCHRVLTSE